MPEKEGSDEKKDAKAVVNKKQKQMMNQEQLDLSSVAESFGGQIVGEPVELDEGLPLAAAIPYLMGAGIIGTGAVGYDSYEKMRGKKGILPDMTPVVKGVGDTYNKVKDNILQIKKRMGSKDDQDTGGPTGGTRDRTRVNTPPKEELKKIRKQLDKDTYKDTQDRYFNRNNKNDKENKTLSNIVKIGGAGAGGAAITNILKKDQTQKVNQKKKTPNITKTKTGKDGKLPSIKFPGTAHIVGRRSNPQ